MTVPSDVNKHIYAGNGVTRVWPYTFLLYDASHLQVWVKRGDEESALLERGYVLNEQEKTVTYPPEGTGEAPLSAEDQIIIMRVVPVLQLLDLLNQGEFFAEDIEKQFDLVVMMIQQIRRLCAARWSGRWTRRIPARRIRPCSTQWKRRRPRWPPPGR